MIPASLQTLAMSAPVNPGVRAAILRAKAALSRSVFSPPKWTLKMEDRPWKKDKLILDTREREIVKLSLLEICKV